jgi:predicted RNA binding protein YcfA (HicA-like mRNA interferase family)
VNAFDGKPLERLQQSGFSFRRSKESHVFMVTAAAFRCRGKRAESRLQ